MKILQLCHKMPFPLRDGGAISIYHTAMGLSENGAEVTVLAMNTPRCPVDPGSVPAEYDKRVRFRVSGADTRIKPVEALLNLFLGSSYLVSRFHDRHFEDDLINLIRENSFDIIQLEHTYLGLYLPVIRRHCKAKVVLRPQNVENRVWQRYLDLTTNPLIRGYLQIAVNRLKRFEQALSSRVDGILAISPADAAWFGEHSSGQPVRFVPPGLDMEQFRNYGTEKQYQHQPVFYHLGSMDWLPNRQGLQWFTDEVIPLLSEKYPGFGLRIAGKKIYSAFRGMADPHVIIDGEVEDAISYQEDKNVLIVPLLSGGGMRIKIIEAMAMGKTVISTTLGAEGIGCKNGESILLADTPGGFVEQILQCVNSTEQCRQIGQAARDIALSEYDRKKTGSMMTRFYSGLVRDEATWR